MAQARIKKIMMNLNVGNVLLLAVIAALAVYVLPPLVGVQASYTPPAAKKIAEKKEEKQAVTPSPSASEYLVIAEQNVFNPERKIPTEKKDEKPVVKPEFVLYGTLITNDTSLAFIEDLRAPYSTSSRGKRQRPLRPGATMSGYTLSQIYQDRVIMTRGEERMEVRVLDTSHAKQRNGGAAPAAAPKPSVAPQPPGAPAVSAPQRQAQQPPAATSRIDRQRTIREELPRQTNPPN